MSIKIIKELPLYFTLFSVDHLPEDWSDIATRLKHNRRVILQFFKHGSLVVELVPFLLYNVHQAFKYNYNLLKGFEQELLLVLYGKRNFREALSKIGVSTNEKATILLASESTNELKEAIGILNKEFSERGVDFKPFEEDRSLFLNIWKNIFKELDLEGIQADYCRVLELVKERIAISYL
ncbi:MAG: hypothetical protein RMI79_02090 [Nitrososphaerota archaeon]|nr:hypothetical protein [Nitrososphaerota archaeon]